MCHQPRTCLDGMDTFRSQSECQHREIASISSKIQNPLVSKNIWNKILQNVILHKEALVGVGGFDAGSVHDIVLVPTDIEQLRSYFQARVLICTHRGVQSKGVVVSVGSPRIGSGILSKLEAPQHPFYLWRKFRFGLHRSPQSGTFRPFAERCNSATKRGVEVATFGKKSDDAGLIA